MNSEKTANRITLLLFHWSMISIVSLGNYFDRNFANRFILNQNSFQPIRNFVRNIHRQSSSNIELVQCDSNGLLCVFFPKLVYINHFLPCLITNQMKTNWIKAMDTVVWFLSQETPWFIHRACGHVRCARICRFLMWTNTFYCAECYMWAKVCLCFYAPMPSRMVASHK